MVLFDCFLCSKSWHRHQIDHQLFCGIWKQTSKIDWNWKFWLVIINWFIQCFGFHFTPLSVIITGEFSVWPEWARAHPEIKKKNLVGIYKIKKYRFVKVFTLIFVLNPHFRLKKKKENKTIKITTFTTHNKQPKKKKNPNCCVRVLQT